MITPLDIQNKEFKKSLFGYKTKDVDGYLDDINRDYEELYRENVELKDKISILTDQIRQYNNLEETLKDTLVIAQTTADEVTSSSRKKAELIIEEAEMDAKDHIVRAKKQVDHIKKEYEHLRKEMLVFKSRYEAFMRAQLSTTEDFYKDFEARNALENQNDKAEVIDRDDVDDLGA